MSLTIAVSELEEMRSLCGNLVLIDVRNPDEYQVDSIPESRNVPLTELTDAFADLNTEDTIVFVCQSGIRSLKAVNFAQSIGFMNSRSLEGGINAWSQNESS